MPYHRISTPYRTTDCTSLRHTGTGGGDAAVLKGEETRRVFLLKIYGVVQFIVPVQ